MSACTTVTTFIGLGSNLGNRARHLRKAVALLGQIGTVTRTSFLYETAPVHITEQPNYLNAVVQLRTSQEPQALLNSLKEIESAAGREAMPAIRFGPRTLDLDLLLYGSSTVSVRPAGKASRTTTLEGQTTVRALDVPHPRLSERRFVLQPLVDLVPDMRHPTLGQTFADLLKALPPAEGCADAAAEGPIRRVLPVGMRSDNGNLWSLSSHSPSPSSGSCGDVPRSSPARIFGVLNVTPDSFSADGVMMPAPQAAADYPPPGAQSIGTAAAVAAAVRRAEAQVVAGADVIDLGAESTRPGAEPVPPDLQLERLLPVIAALRPALAALPLGLGRAPPLLSVDTTSALVAREAVGAGVDIVNDVSGGADDPDMLRTVAALQVPIVLMHRRGTAKSMTTAAAKTYGGDGSDAECVIGSSLVATVAAELMASARAAEDAGIPRWQLLLDPGLGFAKRPQQSFELLRSLPDLSERLSSLPLLIGPSRKGFLAHAIGPRDPRERDVATAAACAIAAASGGGSAVTAVRTHNVEMTRDALAVAAHVAMPWRGACEAAAGATR